MTQATYRQDCPLVVVREHCHTVSTVSADSADSAVSADSADSADGSLHNTIMNCPVIAVRTYLEDDTDMSAYYR